MSDWSDLAEDAKETSIIHLLLDETRTSQLLQVLDRKVNASTLPANSLISQFIDSASFPTFFLNWIVHQIQPFVAYRVRDESDTNLFEISTSDSQLQRAHRAGSFSTNHTAPSTDAILPSETVSKALKAPSKPKKRMTTNPVSLSVGATLSGNIASATNSTEILVGGSGAGSDNSTEPSNKSISAQKVSSNANIGKKHKSELFPQGFQDAKMRIGASDAESTQFCAAQSPNVISSNVTYNTSSVASSNSSLKGKYEHLDTALSAAGSYGLKQGSALSKASDVRKKIVPYSVQLVPSRVTSPSSNHAVSRMSTVLTSLIINQHITIGDAVLLLAKLCSLSLPDPAEGVQVVVTADDGSKFPTLLTSSDLFHLFTVNTMQCLLPVIKVLGDPVALGFAESPVLQR